MRFFFLLLFTAVAVGADDRKLTAADLERAIALGRTHMVANQKADGTFHYEFHCGTLKARPGDNVTRQAGAVWGLALLFRHAPERDLERALRRSLDFFISRSKTTAAGGAYILYPQQRNSTGAVALIGLSLVDYLRAEHSLTAAEKTRYKDQLTRYVRFLVSLRTTTGQFHSSYTNAGKGVGRPSPYFDGETLLCLVRAAKYAGHDKLKQTLIDSAGRMHKINVVEPLQRDPDSSTTKGFYQWSTMAYYELYTSKWPGTGKYARRAIQLGHWMIDTHRVLRRRRNTAYAFEGLTHAAELARLTGDRRARAKFTAAVDTGLAKLLSWQVGSPRQNDYLARLPRVPPRAVGGILNHPQEPWLRIDVVQHQMHALVLARTWLYRNAD